MRRPNLCLKVSDLQTYLAIHMFSVLMARRKIAFFLAISRIKTKVDNEDKTVCSFEALVFIYKITRCHNPENHTVLSMLTGESRNFKICRHIVP
jgi:hypothetical protein